MPVRFRSSVTDCLRLQFGITALTARVSKQKTRAEQKRRELLKRQENQLNQARRCAATASVAMRLTFLTALLADAPVERGAARLEPSDLAAVRLGGYVHHALERAHG
jgi:hypothetical protein